jgi:hypothetical protein
MHLKRPHVATLDHVIITREIDAALIRYRAPGFWTTHLTLGAACFSSRRARAEASGAAQ